MALRTKVLAPLLVSATGIAASLLGGCSSDSNTGAGCVTDRQFFLREVWGPFMGQQCGRCHMPGGPAVDQGAKFVLQNPNYPTFIDANLGTIREIGKITYEGKSEILQKPLGKMNHGGGQVLQEGSPEYAKLQELVSRLDSGEGDKCAGSNTVLTNVEMLSPTDTLRKAAIDLAGRLPTQAEYDAVAAGGEAALDGALDGLMKEDVFYDRVREMYNDLFLTDRGLQFNGAAINFTNENLYPGLAPYKDSMSPQYNDGKRPFINRAIAREPLDLIAYVVRNDRPFSEVVTANYAVVNPFSAIAYGVNVPFADPNNEKEFHEAQVSYAAYDMVPAGQVPHAGVFSTPSFLNRWQTTPTNRNRARSRRVFQFFLGTDILKIADRPVDASKLTAIQNPTMNSEYCNVCHRTIDPVAGAFRGWDEQDYERFDPKDPWKSDMEAPGFNGQKMDPSFYPKAVQWLGPELVKDDRFAIGATYIAYQGLTGRKPLQFPNDLSSPTYSAKIAGWEAQYEFFQQTAKAFRESNLNFKLLVKMIVKSPYYRGVSWKAGGDPAQIDAQLADVGIGQILTPESLNRKIAAVLGVHWRKDYEYDKKHDWLEEDFPLLYGGLDSDSVIERAHEPNGIMAGVAQRMANEMACKLTAWDFTKPQGDRSFFKAVQVDQVPMSAGSEVPGAVAAIKANIKQLHELILGEKLADDDPELARTYSVFIDTWKELQAGGTTTLQGACQGRIDPNTGVAIPDMQRINDDKNFTVRSWGAVMTYLLSDWKFINH